MQKLFYSIVVSVLLTLPAVALSHPGLKDREGCHTEDDGNNYHCHRTDDEGEKGVQWIERREEERGEAGGDEVDSRMDRLEDRIDELEGGGGSKYYYSSGDSFDDDKALITAGGSVAAIGIGSLIGISVAPDYAGPILASTLGAGILSTSIFSIQVGLGSKTAILGGIMVGVSAFGPSIAAGAMQ